MMLALFLKMEDFIASDLLYFVQCSYGWQWPVKSHLSTFANSSQKLTFWNPA